MCIRLCKLQVPLQRLESEKPRSHSLADLGESHGKAGGNGGSPWDGDSGSSHYWECVLLQGHCRWWVPSWSPLLEPVRAEESAPSTRGQLQPKTLWATQSVTEGLTHPPRAHTHHARQPVEEGPAPPSSARTEVSPIPTEGHVQPPKGHP